MTSFATHSKKNNVESSHQSIMTVIPDARMLFRMFTLRYRRTSDGNLVLNEMPFGNSREQP